MASLVSRRPDGRSSTEVGVATVGPVTTSPTVSAVPPPFARAPPEDRSKYEKLFCYDFDSDPDETDGGLNPKSHRKPPISDQATESNVTGPKQQSVSNGSEEDPTGLVMKGRAKLTDEDSIGSATDLKNGSDEELDDRLDIKWVFIQMMYKKAVRLNQILWRCRDEADERSDVGSETVSSSVYHGECDSIRTKDELQPCKTQSNSRSGKFGHKKQAAAASSSLESSDALVGHALGDRPLLADDELDEDDVNRVGSNRNSSSGLPKSSLKTSRLPSVPLPFR